jgi:hypothetical protein
MWYETSFDGWKYGMGEYSWPASKVLTEKVKVQELLPAKYTWLMGKLKWAADALKVGSDKKMDVFYIWALAPTDLGNAQRRIAGEWTVLHGGKAARDAYFSSIFEPAIYAAPSGRAGDRARVNAVAAGKVAPVLLTPENLQKEVADLEKAVANMKKEVPAPQPGGSTSWPLWVAVSLVAWTFFNK